MQLLRAGTVRPVLKQHSRKLAWILFLVCCWPYQLALATVYTNPGNATAPLDLYTGDNFTTSAGLFQSTGSSVTPLGTVQIDPTSTGNNFISITGGSISATGTSVSGSSTTPTVPIYGANTASTTINVAAGTNITQNPNQTSAPVAITMTGPLVLNNLGTITGSITAGAGSTLNNGTTGGGGGTIAGPITLGAGSTFTNSGTVQNDGTNTDLLTLGAGSTLIMNTDSAVFTAVSGGTVAGNGSTLTFTNTLTGANAPTFVPGGLNILNINSAAAINSAAFPTYAVNNAVNIANNGSLTIATSSNVITGSASTNVAGTLTIDSGAGTSPLPSGSLTISGTAGRLTDQQGITLPGVTTVTATSSPAIYIASTKTMTNNGTLTLNSASGGGINGNGGTATLQNNGIINIDTTSSGTFANLTLNNGTGTSLTGPITYGTLNVYAPVSGLTTPNNYLGGSIYISTATTNGVTTIGSWPYTIAYGNKVYFGQDSFGNTGAKTTYTTVTTAIGSTSGISNLTIFSGATATINAAITFNTLNTPALIVESGGTLTVNGAIGNTSGSATEFYNAGTFILNGGTMDPGGTFMNSGAFNIQSAFVPANFANNQFTNTGYIYLASGGSITTTSTSNLAWGGTLIIGQNSSGGNFTAYAFVPTNKFSVPTVDLYNGSSISGATAAVTTTNVYVTGTATNANIGLNVSGLALTTGMDSFGTVYPLTAFNALNAIGLTTASTFPTINVAAGAFSTNMQTISNVNVALYVASGATLAINSSFTGAASVGTNLGTMNISSTFGLSKFTNSATSSTSGGVINFLTGAINNTNISNVSFGTSASNPQFSGIVISGNNVENSATITNTGSISLTGTLANGTSTGTIINNSSGTITLSGGSSSNANNITNNTGGTINITGATTNTGIITNHAVTTSGVGGLNISAQLAGASTIVNAAGATLNFTNGAGNSTTGSITNSGIFNISGTCTNSSSTAMQNAGTLNLNGTLNGSGSIMNTGIMYFNNGTNANVITNQATGNIYFPSSTASTNTSVIINNGTISVAATVYGDGTIQNNATGIVNLATGTSIVNAIINNGGNIDVTGNIISTGGITNTTGILTIGGNINLSNSLTANITSTGTVIVNGNQQILTQAATSFINSGPQIMTIYGPNAFSSLQAIGAIDLNDADLTVNVDVTDTDGGPQSYTIFSSVAGVTPPIMPTPVNTLDRVIAYTMNANTIIVTVNAAQVTGALNQEVSTVLNNMFGNISNNGQQELYDLFYSVNRSLNEDLHEMIPLSNSVQLDSRMQTTAFTKIETRLAGLRNGWGNSVHGGINAGDISPVSAMWLSATGSLTAQGQNGNDAGYNAKSGLFLLGRDHAMCNDLIGMAGGFSLSHVKEFSNTDFISNIYRWHALVYGSHNFESDNYWDWLFTTSANNNVGTRHINVAGVDLSTHADFRAYQFATKLTRGKGFDFCSSYRLTPFTFVQYAFEHQNAYTETGSVAALSVQSTNQSVLTLGLGTRFNLPLDAYNIIGMRELRAAVTYDVINSGKNTTASFVVGSSSFSVASSPVRLALLLGAGITFEYNEHVQFAFDYDFEVRSHFTDNTGMVKIKYVF